ncbi:cytochrome c biogenesis CcdA family protein [Gorillibacterium massiliense]|uniref:cytochrome c biogenesis CcdA family protein n=1 Tax=Gorillibacterium massiliense TaxID=1280390 RepID=UPI0004AF386A|nr:cytochrome c biogenesis protein CcdA [Gorillibacterium massiliense]
MSHVNLGIAFIAGIASFVSPCCLPLYPSYLSYITGISVQQLKEQPNKDSRRRVLSHSFFFLLGFSVVFYTINFGANFVSDFFIEYRDLIRQLSAILILVMGLFMLGVFKPQFLMREKKVQIKWRSAGYLSSFFVGIGFSAGWSPCIGPILSIIAAMAASEPGSWFLLTTFYALGFGIPFMGLSLFIGSARKLLRFSSAIMKGSGAIMVVLAVLLYTDRMTLITAKLNGIAPDWLKF